MKLFRADSRSGMVMQTQFPMGFTAWNQLSIDEVRLMVTYFVNKSCSLPLKLVENLAGKKTLRDLSAHIKFTKDKSSTFWVSTAINQECGGQGVGGTIYEMTIPLREFCIQRNDLIETRRVGLLNPSLMMDHPDIKQATMIGLNHGPLEDAEVSFFTPIPLSYITSPTMIVSLQSLHQQQRIGRLSMGG